MPVLVGWANQKPMFRHTCPRCVYLGRHVEYDLYYCRQSNGKGVILPVILARYGDAGGDYISGRPSGRIDINDPLWVGRLRASEYRLPMAMTQIRKQGA